MTVPDAAASRPPVQWRAFRRDPLHAPELAVLYALPRLAPRVGLWRLSVPAHEERRQQDAQARRVVRGSERLAAWAGAITGTSFYVGMLPAVVTIYYEQVLVVLRIAAVYGHDPEDPARAAELLVLQGRHGTTASAQAALLVAGSPPPRETQLPLMPRAVVALRQLPPMIGLQLRRLRTPLDAIVTGAEVAAFFVPVISIPVWAYASSHSTRRLGRAAIRYYQSLPPGSPSFASVVLPPSPNQRERRRFVVTMVAAVAVLGAVAFVIPLGRFSHVLPLGGVVLAEVALVLSIFRLVLVTRPVRRDGAADSR